jgi:hypothetical protein
MGRGRCHSQAGQSRRSCHILQSTITSIRNHSADKYIIPEYIPVHSSTGPFQLRLNQSLELKCSLRNDYCLITLKMLNIYISDHVITIHLTSSERCSSSLSALFLSHSSLLMILYLLITLSHSTTLLSQYSTQPIQPLPQT